jgi:GTP cyclohydrolase I
MVPNKLLMENGIRIFLGGLGVDLRNQHILRTPERVARAWADTFCNGYQQEPKKVLGTVFFTKEYDEMIVQKDIPFMSICQHHLIPFLGTAKIGYIPGKSGKIVGLSKLARLLDVFSQRLQIQEELTVEVAKILYDVLHPSGVGVVLTAEHMCLTQRGVRKPGSKTITSCLLGSMKKDPKTRAEFLGF